MKEELYNYMMLNSGVSTIQNVLANFLVALCLSFLIYVSYRLSH